MVSKIKETKYPKSDNKGNSCLVVLENGVDGFFNYKGAFPFAVGEDVDYEATKTEKKSKPGEFYNVLKLSKAGSVATAPQQSGNAPVPPKAPHTPNIAQMKFDGRMKVLELGINALIGGRFSKDTDEEAATKTFIQEWSSFTDTLVDEIFTGK